MSHYIRTIQTSFTSGLPSSSSSSSAWSSPYSLPSIMNQYPPGLTPDWRGPIGSSGPSTYNTHTTKRRTAVSLRALTSVHRRPPPPPPTTQSPRTQPASTTYMKFDPFADENCLDLHSVKSTTTPVIYHTSPRYRPSYIYSTQIPAAAPERSQSRSSADKEARAKLVAGILLNRAQVGKPPRRRSIGEPKTYIKSGLSSVVSVEA